MNGWLIINKPKNFTSNDVVVKIKNTLKVPVGHTGTLDPQATGVLPLALGKATKLIQFLPSDKTYIAQIYLGIKTNTMDSEGEIIYRSEKIVSFNEIVNIIPKFLGVILQKPPLFSAISINGTRLYKLARKGISIDNIPLRKVNIYSIDLLDFKFPLLTLKIKCSKGTYIRSLADSIGNELGSGAYLYELQRIEANGFDIFQSTELNSSNFDILPIDLPFKHLDKINLDSSLSKKFKYGQKIIFKNSLNKIFKIYDENDNFIGIGEVINNYLKPLRVLA